MDAIPSHLHSQTPGLPAVTDLDVVLDHALICGDLLQLLNIDLANELDVDGAALHVKEVKVMPG
jgi:hypothetical protein